MKNIDSNNKISCAYPASEQLNGKGFLFILFLLALCITSFAQPCSCTNGRYLQTTFGKVSLGTNVQFTQNASVNYDGTTEQESMDIWGPASDNCTGRPLIIWVHGGGFSQQDRNAPDVVAMCDTFARHGFVVASIDYRDGYWGTSGPVNQTYSVNPTPYDHNEFTRAAYRAMQDAKCAVRFFKSNAATYGVDTNHIFMGGTSAGGWTSLLVAYLDKASEKPLPAGPQSSVIGMYQRPDLGNIDGTGGWNNASSKVRGIISIFGAAFDTALVDGPADPAAYHFHEYSDPVVNFYYGAPFQGQYQNFDSYWGDYYMDMQSKNVGGTSKSRWVSGSQHSLYPYRGIVSSDVALFLDSMICSGNQTTGINTDAGSGLQLYPNPGNGVFVVHVDVTQGPSSIRVFNLLGKEVYGSELTEGENHFNIEEPNGVYIVELISGNKRFNRRLIVNR